MGRISLFSVVFRFESRTAQFLGFKGAAAPLPEGVKGFLGRRGDRLAVPYLPKPPEAFYTFLKNALRRFRITAAAQQALTAYRLHSAGKNPNISCACAATISAAPA